MNCFRFLSGVVAFTALTASVSDARKVWNQTEGFNITVDLGTWSNFGENGGCVTCRYACVKGSLGPGGMPLNYSNSSMMNMVPPGYTQMEQNGCCNAPGAEEPPNCDADAKPKANSEDCGFLQGPTLIWNISSSKKQSLKKSTSAALFSSVDCKNFWLTTGETEVTQGKKQRSEDVISGSKVMNKGCYGDPKGVPMVLAGCLTSELDLDGTSSKSYKWNVLAKKCRALSGVCTRTNGAWGRNLQCCSDAYAIGGQSTWNQSWEYYMKEGKGHGSLSGIAIVGIIFAGVIILMLCVHMGAKCHERKRETEMKREMAAQEDYDDIIQPLTAQSTVGGRRARPAQMEVSLAEGDNIFRRAEPEVLYEGNMS